MEIVKDNSSWQMFLFFARHWEIQCIREYLNFQWISSHPKVCVLFHSKLWNWMCAKMCFNLQITSSHPTPCDLPLHLLDHTYSETTRHQTTNRKKVEPCSFTVPSDNIRRKYYGHLLALYCSLLTIIVCNPTSSMYLCTSVVFVLFKKLYLSLI